MADYTFIISLSLPKRLVLPIACEAHSGGIDVGIFCQEGKQFCFHVVVGRYDIEAILDNAKVEVDS